MQQNYPAVRFVVRYGAMIAWLVPALIAVAGLAGFALQCGPWISSALIVGAAALFCVLRLVVELVQIVAETLLPQ